LIAGRPYSWVQVNKASVQGACKPFLAVETFNYGNFSHTNAIYTTINSLVKGQIPKELLSDPIPSDCYILHNIAIASHHAERRATQNWRDAFHAEKGRQPTFEELLVFLQEQANVRKSNSTEILSDGSLLIN
jgi:hypothetical protein